MRCPGCAREYMTTWLAANHARVLARRRLVRRVKNRGQENARNVAYRAANLEKEHARSVAYYTAHADQRKAAYAKWKSANPEVARAHVRRVTLELRDAYVAARLGARTKDVPKELMEAKRVELKLKRLIKEMKK